MMLIRKSSQILAKLSGYVTLASIYLFSASIFAEGTPAGGPPTGSIGDLANNVVSSFSSLAKLMTAGAYIAGFGFVMASMFKFKQHKDNPTQHPIGGPIAMLIIGAALIFMPTVFSSVGITLFGTGANVGSVTGFSTVPTFTPSTQ